MKLVAAPESWAGLRDDWVVLVRQLAPPAGIFADPDFPAAWAQVFAADEQLEPYAVRDATGTLVGVLPVRFRDGVATFIGDPEICDYMDIVAAPGAGHAVADALITLLEERDCGAAEIRGLAEGSPTLEALPAAARRHGWTVRSAQEAVCPVITLPARWESYLDGLKGKNRHEVRRKLRHLADGGARVALEAAAAPQGMDDALESLFAMMRDSRRDKAEFLDDRRAAFFRELVRRFGPPRHRPPLFSAGRRQTRRGHADLRDPGRGDGLQQRLRSRLPRLGRWTRVEGVSDPPLDRTRGPSL